jgi:predicted ArsR family transcriptional regulator
MQHVASEARRPVLAAALELEGPWSCKEVAAELGLPIPAVAYHVGQLRKDGALRVARSAARRGARETWYAFTPTARRELASALAYLSART